MFIVGFTESSARFITGLIVVLIVGAIFGAISQSTGINPFILIGVALAGFVFLIARLIRGSGDQRAETQCLFRNDDNSWCKNEMTAGSIYCDLHAGVARTATPTPVPKANQTFRSTKTLSEMPLESRCVFTRANGSTCINPRQGGSDYCAYHSQRSKAASR